MPDNEYTPRPDPKIRCPFCGAEPDNNCSVSDVRWRCDTRWWPLVGNEMRGYWRQSVLCERDMARAEAAALKAEAETFELQVDQLSEQFQALLGDYEALRVQLGSATSSIDEAPDGTILFESEVPASFSKKYSECVRRVRVLANDRVSGGLMVFGMEGWHSEPDGSGGRDFTPEEIAQHRYGDMVGVWANQGERVCIRLLLDRVSALKAKLDASVPREVAERAAARAFDIGTRTPSGRVSDWKNGAGTGWDWLMNLQRNCTDEWPEEAAAACLARAEAEHAEKDPRP